MKDYVHGGDVYRHPQVLDFSANVNPLGTPRSVIEAAKKSMEAVFCYPDACQEKLRKALAVYEQVPQDWLICGNGAAELIFALVQAIKPKKALLAVPTFAEYEQALQSIGCEIVYEELDAKRQFRLGEEFLQKLTKDLNLIFLCNPNNPTGLLIDRDLLEKIREKCEENHIWLVIDECFLDFVLEPENHTLKKKLEESTGLFLLKAFTKRYAMAGLRLGYGICSNEQLLRKMEKQLQPWNVSTPAQEAGLAALKEEIYLEKARTLIFKEKEFLKENLEQLGFQVWDSSANYLFFYGEKFLYEKLLQEQVMIRDCGNYRGLSKGYYRIAIRTREENIRLLQAIRKVRE
jgi:threonine-phosphate decarboxylase